MCRHKFRATIGKSNMIPHKSRVLVAYSGGAASAALCDMLLDSVRNPDLHKKLNLEPAFVFIDESICSLNDESSTSSVASSEVELMHCFGFKSFITSLEMYFEPTDKFYEQVIHESQVPLSSDYCKQKWNFVLNNFKSLTSKEEYIRRTRNLLLLKLAEKEKIPFVFLGTMGSRLAINLLTDVLQGKGNQLHYEVGFCDDRHEVKFVKPLREFVKKEIVFWNQMRKVKYRETQTLTTKRDKNASLSKLTEAFVTSLERDFPATVYTIVRTGNKLKPLEKAEIKCSLCLSQIDDESNHQYSATKALLLSEKLSKNVHEEIDFHTHKKLCYGCRILMKDSLNSSMEIIPEICAKSDS
ncbi:cytoplasmic tRNA 2-thiolation protein 2-A-like protein [Dinothrombium tinctorium]|uniref:Cytoplasmic tRNA 2-thiolation protein 2 n=1 Tax=Dinothrombium tinctorium TaxID=1965070 RepID=A0A3S3PKA9_9ACAR|nr:cytoplasmic tRNA 2-thiolation protein 2-A-like protein [Dinothrombium tinctorium]